jgi:hypothetical protein
MSRLASRFSPQSTSSRCMTGSEGPAGQLYNATSTTERSNEPVDNPTLPFPRPSRDIVPRGAEPPDLLVTLSACRLRSHRNSVPSTHIRCRMPLIRRANATIAFLRPRVRAMRMAEAARTTSAPPASATLAPPHRARRASADRRTSKHGRASQPLLIGIDAGSIRRARRRFATS